MSYLRLYTLNVSSDRAHVSFGSTRQRHADALAGTYITQYCAITTLQPGLSSKDRQNILVSIRVKDKRSCLLSSNVSFTFAGLLFHPPTTRTPKGQSRSTLDEVVCWMFEVGKALGLKGEPPFSQSEARF